MGIVVDANKPDYVQGDFLVRGLVGRRPRDGPVAVGTPVRPGQVVRLHARDADSADRDLRDALDGAHAALGGRAAGGRARVRLQRPRARHVRLRRPRRRRRWRDALGGAPAAGFFAAGEIGPVGGEYFLHGFTATVAVFAVSARPRRATPRQRRRRGSRGHDVAGRTVLLTGATGGLGPRDRARARRARRARSC